MEFKKQYGNVTSEIIYEFEEKMSFVFPSDYRSFLLSYNGGIPVKKKFLINNSEGFDSIDVFFGLKLAKEFLNIEYLLEYYSDRFPDGIIPIGEDPGGNYVCLNVNEGENYGKVYFYDHEVENEDAKGNLTWDNLSLIANNFTDFLEKLH